MEAGEGSLDIDYILTNLFIRDSLDKKKRQLGLINFGMDQGKHNIDTKLTSHIGAPRNFDGSIAHALYINYHVGVAVLVILFILR